MDVAKVTTKGQVTIPKEVRESLDLGTGSKLVFIKRGSDWVVFNPDQIQVSQPVQPVDDSERNRILQELAARYDLGNDRPEIKTQEIGDVLNRLTYAFRGVAEDQEWETDRDVVEYIKSLRRDHPE